jgi:hypothetical protein
MYRMSAGERMRSGKEFDAAVVELAEHGVGGDLLVHDQHGRIVAGDGFPVVAERDDLAGTGGIW